MLQEPLYISWQHPGPRAGKDGLIARLDRASRFTRGGFCSAKLSKPSPIRESLIEVHIPDPEFPAVVTFDPRDAPFAVEAGKDMLDIGP